MRRNEELQTADVLVVEDEPKLAALLRDYLQAAGHRVACIDDGLAVEPAVRAKMPDLILLDIMLPGRDGLEICKALRTFTNVPIMLITARVEEIDRLLGLDLGADDYICKPFSPREVVARARAILRRLARPVEPGLHLDAAAYRATFNGSDLELTPVEFRLLACLAGAPGRVFSRDHLMDRLYDDHRVVTDRTVDSHVKNLRRKLEQASPEQDLIHSIYGVGYKLEV
ncbi:MAG: two-component system response regulator BaeR [Gammaproteobacteria bacterium HGW-Gammaproteobacteria-6]|nr:MAG: two-component system response regulator BaeR [Gammaproteobacteria bacterium HGW-Gammaproteobacteria-6]